MNAAKLQRLGDLLARYDAGDSSLAEERELRTLLADPALPDRFAARRRMMRGFAALATPSLDAPAPWEIAEPQRPPRVRARPRARLHRLLAVAAGVAVLVAAALLYLARPVAEQQPIAQVTPGAIDWSRYEVTDPDEAARITRGALREVSTRLDRGGRLTQEQLDNFEPLHHAF